MKPLFPSLILAWLFALQLSVHAGSIGSPEQAIATFRKTWNETLEKALRESSYYTQLKTQVFESGRVGARQITSVESLNRVTSTLSAEEKKRLILFGDLSALQSKRTIWAVENPRDIGSGFEAYLDEKTGSLLFLWIAPEG